MNISETIKMHRKHLKLTQNQLAEQACVNRQVIGKLESGNYKVLFESVLGICQILGLELKLIA